MSDERLRELERRWRETGAVQDEAGLLLERVRVGELEQRRVEFAAFFGHHAAELAVGRSDFAAPPDPLDRFAFQDWLRVLAESALGGAWEIGDHEFHVRMALAAAWGVEACACPALEEVDLWVVEPSVRSAAPTGLQPRLEARPVGASDPVSMAVVFTFLTTGPKGFVGSSPKAVNYARQAGGDTLADLRSELVPWLLGYSDPVRERIRKRAGRRPSRFGDL
ncbi:MAG: hypothetical protein R3F62_22970 [Planctomycetota bacterium]